MTPDQNLEIARRYIASLSAGAGADDLEAFFAPDFIRNNFPIA
jgi:hypothetical protein